MDEKKRLNFNVDASTLHIKEILKKDYLELSMKAISDAKPNRNGSWFTKESLEKCKDSFKDKPILGYFKHNDFVSHNGKWSKDQELNMDYWDTLGEGERILGFIRESDNVEVIEDPETGLHWITVSCALWTQYCYKQVKRLLKDAIRAQKKGGPTKNISVEINVLDYEDIVDPDTRKHIMKINAFELVGITILGSSNGIPVEPGIEGAELSVLENLTAEEYGRQFNKVRLAYEKLDQSKNIEEKENREMDMNKENQDVQNLPENADTKVDEQTKVDKHKENFEDKNAPVEDNKPTEDPKKEDEDPKADPVEDNKEPEAEKDPKANFDKDPENDEGGKAPEPKEAEGEKKPEEVKKDFDDTSEDGIDDDNENEDDKVNPIFNLTYMVERSANNVECYKECIRYYEQAGVIGGDKVISMLKRHAAVYGSMVKECAHMAAEIADEAYDEKKFTQHEKAQEATVTGYFEKDKDGSAIMDGYKAYDAVAYDKIQLENEHKKLNEKFEALEKELNDYKVKELLINAQDYASKGNLTEEQSKQLFEDCKAGKYADAEAVKTAVALMSFEAQANSHKEGTIYSAGITKVSTNVPADDAEKSTKKSCWDTMKDYCNE